MSLSIFDYLLQLPVNSLHRLYGLGTGTDSSDDQSPWVCKTIFQSLKPLSKLYVMRILFLDDVIRSTDILLWIDGSSKTSLMPHVDCIQELLNLRILEEGADENASNRPKEIPSNVFTHNDFNNNRILRLNKMFQKNFRIALCGAQQPWSKDTLNPFGGEIPNSLSSNRASLPPSNSSHPTKVGQFASYYDFNEDIKDTVKNFLLGSGLMMLTENTESTQTNGTSPVPKITSKGYEYMLKSRQEQVWMFVVECLHRAKAHSQQTHEEVLYLVLLLSHCSVGTGYSLAALTAIQRLLLTDFIKMGLVCCPTDSPLFFPTSLAVHLTATDLHSAPAIAADKTSGNSLDRAGVGATSSTLGKRRVEDSSGAGGASGIGGGAMAWSKGLEVIVQTNFQVTAYLTSDLHFAMLALFTTIRMRLPNSVVGSITRSSMKEAYRLGITATQIIQFLTIHAHPSVKRKTHVIPENVTDQLLLWENEKNKIIADDAVYVGVSELASGARLLEIWELLRNYARQQRTLLWEEEGKAIAVRAEGYLDLVEFAKRQGII